MWRAPFWYLNSSILLKRAMNVSVLLCMVHVSYTFLDLETVTHPPTRPPLPQPKKKPNRKRKSTTKQESIPAGYILPAHPPWRGGGMVLGYSEQTHGCKNITFPQLRLRAVKRRKEKEEYNTKNIMKYHMCESVRQKDRMCRSQKRLRLWHI